MATHVAVSGSDVLQPTVLGLERWWPSRAITLHAGELYLTSAVLARTKVADDAGDVLRATTRAAFDQFVELGRAAHGLFGDSFGKLGVAQLKVMAPTPGARLIGGFASPVIFVGLRLYWRNELPFKVTRQPGIIDYRTLGRDVAAEWDALLPTVRRVPMKDFDHER